LHVKSYDRRKTCTPRASKFYADVLAARIFYRRCFFLSSLSPHQRS